MNNDLKFSISNMVPSSTNMFPMINTLHQHILIHIILVTYIVHIVQPIKMKSFQIQVIHYIHQKPYHRQHYHIIQYNNNNNNNIFIIYHHHQIIFKLLQAPRFFHSFLHFFYIHLLCDTLDACDRIYTCVPLSTLRSVMQLDCVCDDFYEINIVHFISFPLTQMFNINPLLGLPPGQQQQKTIYAFPTYGSLQF